MVYVKPLGALCNRLRVIEATIQLMSECGDTAVVLWDNNDAECGCDFFDLFELAEELPIEINTNSKLLEDNAKNDAYCFERDKEREFIESYTKNTNREKRYYLSTCSTFYGKPKYEWLYPKEELLLQIKNNMKDMEDEFCVGLHIRRTDHYISRIYSPIELFVEEIETILADKPNAKFYLATDDEKTRELLLHKYKNHIIINKGGVLSRGTKGGMEDAVIDLWCLSLCDEIRGSFWSSFSDAAAGIGKKPVKYLAVDEKTVLHESKLKVDFVDKCRKTKCAVIVGMGYLGKLLYTVMKRDNIVSHIICCDNAESMQKELRFWRECTKVVSVEEAVNECKDAYFLLTVRDERNMKTVTMQLEELGVSGENLERRAGLILEAWIKELR